jgi:hypothetical protein
MKDIVVGKCSAFILGLLLMVPALSQAELVEEDPTALAMTTDLLFVRPLLLVTTVAGSAAYVVSLPFSLAGGNADQAADTLVVKPAKATFQRCLGCTRSGPKSTLKED